MSRFSTLWESGKDTCESAPDERPYGWDGHNANLSHWEHDAPGMATCEKGLPLRPR